MLPVANLLPAPAVAEPSGALPPETQASLVEPLMLFEDDRLTRCGVRAVFGSGSQSVTAAITLHRQGDAAEWVVELTGPELTGEGAPLGELWLTTVRHDTRRTFSKPKALTSGGYEVRGTLAGLDGSTFIQDIMIGGASIATRRGQAAAQTFFIAGPLPHTVRANYLMCAGDLFR